ncbi:MAG TPA: hypothetical protein VK906_16430 [Egicoccus sp.]|nr:hypothetical protein [Egicoccus sp.]HSK24774.1 hypothetical protein [Egicoccus sp.]
MLSSTVRRSLLSLLAVSTVGTLGFSAAATLGVDSADLGAGSSVVASCAPTAGDVEVGDFDTDYAVGPPAGFKVSGLTINVPTACEDHEASVVLVDTADAQVGGGTLAALADGDNTITIDSADAAAVAGVHVVISEPLPLVP